MLTAATPGRVSHLGAATRSRRSQLQSEAACDGTLLRVGLRHSQTLTVDAGMTVPNVSPAFGSFRDMPEVFATAYMVGFIESTCIEALHPYLAADQRTVGIHINVSHSAATPVGMSVTAEVELIAVEGRRLQFRVECRDAKEIIAAGTHDRAIVDLKKFATRLQAKAEEPGIARAMREKAS